jgi:hypothetical protein
MDIDEIKLDEESSIFTNKYFLVTILIAVAGGVYGLTYAIGSLQINFTLYCCSVWFVCLALIFLANYTTPPSMSKLTSSSSENESLGL